MLSLPAAATPKAAKERRKKKEVRELTTRDESWRKWIVEKRTDISLVWDMQAIKYGHVRNVSDTLVTAHRQRLRAKGLVERCTTYVVLASGADCGLVSFASATQKRRPLRTAEAWHVFL